MNKKKWVEKKAGLLKLKKVAEFNREKSIDDIEELDFLINSFDKKINSL